MRQICLVRKNLSSLKILLPLPSVSIYILTQPKNSIYLNCQKCQEFHGLCINACIVFWFGKLCFLITLIKSLQGCSLNVLISKCICFWHCHPTNKKFTGLNSSGNSFHFLQCSSISRLTYFHLATTGVFFSGSSWAVKHSGQVAGPRDSKKKQINKINRIDSVVIDLLYWEQINIK